MSAPELNELLSAYLDGEVTAEERAIVEQRLEQSPATRESLDEFAEVGELVRSLPRPAAPATLAGQVLDRLNLQETPLPTAAGAARPSSFAEHLRHRRWKIAGLVTAACVAAGLFLARKPVGPLQENMVALNHEHQLAAPGEKDVAAAAPAAAPMTTPALSEVAGVAVQPQPATLNSLENERESLAQLVRSRGRSLKRGEVVRMLQSNSEDTRVLLLTVTDSVEFAGTTRTLFAKNGIEPIEIESPSSPPADELTPSRSNEDVYVVFIEGNEQQLGQALDEIDNSPAVMAMGDYGTLKEVTDASVKEDAADLKLATESRQGRAVVKSADALLPTGDRPLAATEPQAGDRDATANAPGQAEAARQKEAVAEKSEPVDGAEPPAPAETALAEAEGETKSGGLGNSGYQVAVPREAADVVVHQVQRSSPRAVYSQRAMPRSRAAGRPEQVTEFAKETRPSRVLIILQGGPQPAAAPAKP